MLLHTEDFVARTHPILLEPELLDGIKRHFKELGIVETTNQIELLDIMDECFDCWEKLTTPYIYWHGVTGTLALHAKSAAKLALGLAQDAYESTVEKPPTSLHEFTNWLSSPQKPYT